MTPDAVTLAHGAGGRASEELLRRVVLPALGGGGDHVLCDAAVVPCSGPAIAFTTDAFTVTPLFFPGGNIGRLAVFGTVNDLAMVGAVPCALSLSVIAEEGLPLDTLRAVMDEVGAAAGDAGVRIVTGDTKVVGKGAVDRLFLTTSGIGSLRADTPTLAPDRIRPGDAVLVSGTMGDHGLAVLMARENLAFTPVIQSDCAPLTGLVRDLLKAAPSTRCLRDPTRGGLASVLNEFARASGLGLVIEETAVPVRTEVAALCEILGLDPFHLANEGKVVAVVGAEDVEAAREALRRHPLGTDAAVIGRVTEGDARTVVIVTDLGTKRILPYPSGELLPRIC